MVRFFAYVALLGAVAAGLTAVALEDFSLLYVAIANLLSFALLNGFAELIDNSNDMQSSLDKLVRLQEESQKRPTNSTPPASPSQNSEDALVIAERNGIKLLKKNGKLTAKGLAFKDAAEFESWAKEQA
ncbi:hypothetical protein [Roseivivax sp. CAU 1753]